MKYTFKASEMQKLKFNDLRGLVGDEKGKKVCF